MYPAHHFGNYADLRVVAYDRKIMDNAVGEWAVRKIAQIKYILDIHAVPKTCGDNFFVSGDYLGTTGTHSSESENGNVNHTLCPDLSCQ